MINYKETQDILFDVKSMEEWKKLDWHRDIGLLETCMFVIGVYAVART